MSADAGLILRYIIKSIGAVCFLQPHTKLKQERSVVHIAIHFVEACLTMYSSTFASLTGTRKNARPLIQRYVSKMSPAQSRVRGNELGLVPQAAVQLHGLR